MAVVAAWVGAACGEIQDTGFEELIRQGPVIQEDIHEASELIPLSGIRLGVNVGGESLEAFEQTIEREVKIERLDFGWLADFTVDERVRKDLDRGKIPLITWSPDDTPLDHITDGRYDELIHARARGARALRKAFFLRWAHEPNGDWFAWSGQKNGGKDGGPGRYIAAYKRIREVFASEGARNVAFVWSPNAVNVPDEPWNRWDQYWPGRGYVDWIGINAYNFGTSKPSTSWLQLTNLLKDIYSDYSKPSFPPIMLSETGCSEQGGDKSAWIRNMRESIPRDFPRVRIVVWENVTDRTDPDNVVDWSVSSSQPALEAFRGLASDPRFSQ